MFWFIVLTIVLNNGEVYTDIRPVTDPKYNNEKECNDVGRILVDQKQIEIGTNDGKVYYICQSFSQEQLDKGMGKTNL